MNYICQVITDYLLCGLPVKKVPNDDPLTKNYFDLFLCEANHRILAVRSQDTEGDPEKDTPPFQ